MYLHKNMKVLKEQISRELQEAVHEMRKNGYRAIRYDPHLLMIDAQGERYGDPVWYKGILTRKLIEECIEPGVARIVYCNGIDGAASPREMYQYNEYDPDVEVIEIDVWSKD